MLQVVQVMIMIDMVLYLVVNMRLSSIPPGYDCQHGLISRLENFVSTCFCRRLCKIWCRRGFVIEIARVGCHHHVMNVTNVTL